MKILGSQVEYVAKVFEAKLHPGDAGGITAADLTKRLQLAKDFTKVIMQVVISVLGLIGSVVLLLFVTDQSANKLACSTIGLIIGYWLR